MALLLLNGQILSFLAIERGDVSVAIPVLSVWWLGDWFGNTERKSGAGVLR